MFPVEDSPVPSADGAIQVMEGGMHSTPIKSYSQSSSQDECCEEIDLEVTLDPDKIDQKSEQLTNWTTEPQLHDDGQCTKDNSFKILFQSLKRTCQNTKRKVVAGMQSLKEKLGRPKKLVTTRTRKTRQRCQSLSGHGQSVKQLLQATLPPDKAEVKEPDSSPRQQTLQSRTTEIESNGTEQDNIEITRSLSQMSEQRRLVLEALLRSLVQVPRILTRSPESKRAVWTTQRYCWIHGTANRTTTRLLKLLEQLKRGLKDEDSCLQGQARTIGSDLVQD